MNEISLSASSVDDVAKNSRQENKFILDATAGYRMMWFNKQHPNTIYLDKREEVKPDIVANFTNMKQFPDNTFNLIVFDPPHTIRNGISDPKSIFQRNFGWLEPETWQYELKEGLSECYRVLAPKGVLVFKWSTYYKNIKQIEPLFPIKPLFSQTTHSHRRGKRPKQETVWFCFMKILDEAKE